MPPLLEMRGPTVTTFSPGSVQSHAAVNWTATYRADSTIVTPYEKWVYHQPGVRAVPQNTNYAANKTKQVAWFVSNCGARSDHGSDGTISTHYHHLAAVVPTFHEAGG